MVVPLAREYDDQPPATIPAEATQPPVSKVQPRRLRYFGDYELLEELAIGGMGIVYRARQISLNRIVAVKMIRAGLLAGDAEVRRFHAEAEAAASLDHPNIVPLYEVGEHGGQQYFSMKLIEGGTLTARIRDGCWFQQHCIAHRSLSVFAPGRTRCCSVAAALIAKVARAVHYAHQRGILHRDIKPGNILLDAQGDPHITDFGLALRLESETHFTMTGTVLGTPNYMSPEQAAGKVNQLTTATDIYSLGAILYELLTGQPPFRAGTPLETLCRVVEEEPARPGTLNLKTDRDLETICLKCLEKDPQRRYHSAAELADDLDRFGRCEPILARRSSVTERMIKWTRRHPVHAAGSAALLFALLAGVAGITWEWRRADRQAALAEQRAEESRDRLLRLHVLNAGQRLEAGDPLAALPWLAAALAEEPPGSHRRDVYRTALANIVRRTPLPEHLWWRPGQRPHLALSPNGQELLLVGDHSCLLRLSEREPMGVPIPGVGAAAFSADGTRFATGADGQGFICSTATAQPILPALIHTGWVTQVAFSPDGRWLMTHGGGGGNRLWNTASGDPGPELARAGNASAAFRPDSRRLATTDQDGWVRLWEIPSVQLLATNRLDSPWQCVFSPNGQWLLVGRSTARDALLLEAATLRRVGSLMPHRHFVEHIAFSADSLYVATGGRDGMARVWTAPEGEPATPPLALESECTALAFSPDGRSIATGSRDGRARVWNARTGEPETPWLRHAAAVRGLAFMPDGQRLCTTSADGAARVWSLQLSRPESLILRDRSEPVWMAHFTANARQLIARGPRTARLFDTSTGQPLTPPLEHGQKVDWVSLSGDGSALLTQCRDRRVRVWSIPAGDLLRVWELGDAIVDAEWLAGEGRFVTLTASGEVSLWSVASNAPLRHLTDKQFKGRHLVVSPDGLWFAAAFSHTKFGLWSSDAEQPVMFASCPGDIRRIRFSPDAIYLATGGEDGRVQFRRTRDGQPVGAVVRHGETILDMAFSPDGRSVASVSADGLVRLTTVPSGAPVGVTLRPAPGAMRVGWSGDSRRVLVVGILSAQVWDATTGAPITPELTHTSEIAGATFTADGRELLTVTDEARLRREPLDAPDWPDADWQFLARALSSQQVDASGHAVPWFGLTETNTLADAEALSARWQQLRPRLRELMSRRR